MKKFLLMAAVATTLVNCSSDFDFSEGQGGGGVSDVIGFQVQGRNSIKRGALQKANHYNFGVFAYKSTDQTNNIMDNYLVGYLDPKGYSTSGSTTDDKPGIVDGKSNWMYEGMGWAQFQGTYAGENVAKNTKYASNNQYQYLRYWDNSAESTCFYAYVPYLNAEANSNKTVSYVDGTAKGTDTDPITGAALNTDKYVMTFPNGTIKHGYDDEQAYEYMYASTKVGKANYGHDVQLEFKRLNAKVNIKFWEDIPGYSVHMIDLGDVPVATGTKHYTISAVPAKKVTVDNSHIYGYDLGKIYTENGVKIQFSDGVKTGIKQYAGTTSSDPLAFATPTAAKIGENRVDATASSTTYFAIPKGHNVDVLNNDAKNIGQTQSCESDLALTGLTFHVSYELISTTGEKIIVKDATVHVPANYCEWEENKAYTYIFKITTNSNGTTGSETPKPTDPSVPTEMALYPIVFDNCTVEDWVDNESEWEITEGTNNTWYDVQLGSDEYSFDNTSEKTLTVKVQRTSKNPTDNTSLVKELTPAATELSVKAPNGDAVITDGNVETTYANADWAINNNVITVPAGAATGKYTITYKASDHDVNANNPATYTENFYVGSECDVKTNLAAVATGADADTYLQILTKTNGADFVDATNQNVTINYPKNLSTSETNLVKVITTPEGKKQVQVAKNAKPGKYELVYRVSGIDAPVVKYTFEVKDYGLKLDKNIINLNNTSHIITASSDYAGGTLACKTSDGSDANVSVSGMTVTVDNNTAEGTYKVIYTVDDGTVSKATYTKTFEVKNTYDLQLSKTTISRGNNVANEAEWSVDAITLSTFKNGVAYRSTSLTVWNGSTEVTNQFDIQANASGNSYVLKVKRAIATGNYTIKFEGQRGKIVEKTITVQD